MNEEVVLKVKGQAFRGWTGVAIEKSVYQTSGSFGLATTDLFPGEAKKWGFGFGDECIVEINGQNLVTGYVEDILIDYDSTTHNIQIGGRDKTGDLVDCSFNEEAKEWKGLSIKAIIERLCKPFNIDVVVDASVLTDANAIWPESPFKANEGDVVFELIRRACSMKAILPICYGDGKLTLTRAGEKYKAWDVLEPGRNILKGSLDGSDKDRFQTYIVKGQGQDSNWMTPSEASSGPIGQAIDNVIKRYRPMIIFADGKSNKSLCDTKAKWEKNRHAGESRSLEYEVQGWTQSNGKVWPLNTMVQVKDKILGINETLLISHLFFSTNESGTITRMKIVDPKTFTVLPEDIKVGSDGFAWMQ